jgi:mono/diheme cytochrome c family protein
MKRTLPLLSLLILLLASACGGASSAPTATAVRPTVIPTYQYQSPTPMPARPTSAATAAPEATADVSADAEAISRGADRFVSLGCSGCHGENAAGGEAKALAGLTMPENDFLAFLRSGGGLGGTHQYASNRISNGGVHNLYLYLVSLGS